MYEPKKSESFNKDRQHPDVTECFIVICSISSKTPQNLMKLANEVELCKLGFEPANL